MRRERCIISSQAVQERGDMLQIQHICKRYQTGKLIQKALDDVSLNLRDNEFVAILGPSGSGKTTLLNIIGGLDRYDSGDLMINGVSTKKYKDRDWDAYRNHTIGFVFQSYNLIPHQSVLANVELALTISGIGRPERRQRARKALEKVGLGDQIDKRPNQLSGGQMQRVAIARALVNDPDILLADEPTGALDSDTSIQVMELLREVAKDRLVVMVTHNPELADAFATRVVRLRDGKIQSDSDVYAPDEGLPEEPIHRRLGKASMSFLTALSLSFNNLRTKKTRTLLTSFAGSIGIIGIALILSLSTGVNGYIKTVEEKMLSEYPLQIQSASFNLMSMMSAGRGGDRDEGSGEVNVIQMITDLFSAQDSNDLAALKQYLDGEGSGIRQYVNSIEYIYDVVPQLYRQNGEEIRQVNPDVSFDALGLGASSSSNSLMSSMMSTNVFYQMPEEAGLYEGRYDVKAGRWPENYDECVLVLTSRGGISDFLLYTLGLRDTLELDRMVQQFIDGENVETPADSGSYAYGDFLGITFKLVNSADYYEYDSQYEIWKDKTNDAAYMSELVAGGEDIKIVGVVQPKDADISGGVLNTGICYPAALAKHVAEQAGESEIVRRQLENESVNVFTNEPFGEESTESGFDLSSLFTIDAGALENAFGFNGDGLESSLADSFDLSGSLSLDGNSLDLSGMADLSAVQLELPEMPPISLEDLMGQLDITASPDAVRQLAGELLSGYQEFAAGNPGADYTGLGEYFLAYLQTPEARETLAGHMKEIIQSGGSMEVSPEQLQELVRRVMAGYQEYAAANGYTDPDRFDEYLIEYLQTPQAQSVLEKWASENLQFSGDLEITQEQLEALAADLAAGYQSYAAANGLPDPAKMGDYFLEYLGTDDAKQKLAAGIGGMVDAGGLEGQIASSVQSYMQETFATLTESISQAIGSQITQAVQQISGQLGEAIKSQISQNVSQLGEELGNAMNIEPGALANAVKVNMDGGELTELLMSLGAAESASCEGNLKKLGYADFDNPSGVNIYPKDFESKEQAVAALDGYNSRMESEGREEKMIAYTDTVGTMMSSVTDIVNIVSYVLIAFVAISLVVSSIMIGVITYISVLERKKEIGILRAIGASKKNISQVFNAETCIIGLCAGLIGIVITLLLLIPANLLIHHLSGIPDLNAVLPAAYALVLILLSVALTLLGGLIPSGKAAKSDPVAALRTD